MYSRDYEKSKKNSITFISSTINVHQIRLQYDKVADVHIEHDIKLDNMMPVNIENILSYSYSHTHTHTPSHTYIFIQ